MCLMLYMGAAAAPALLTGADLRIEAVEARYRAVTQWFSQPEVRFVGAHTGCSCGFPSVMSESPIEFYDGMPLNSDDREADLRSVRALLAMIRRESAHGDRVELYPVAEGEESLAPKGRIDWHLDTLEPDRFFFNERFMHVVHWQGG